MSDEDVDYSQVDWEEQEGEIEALECIFPEELHILEKKPYKFEITINSNPEPEENHLKMLFLVELPHDYPKSVPFLRLKNLCSEFLNNQLLD